MTDIQKEIQGLTTAQLKAHESQLKVGKNQFQSAASHRARRQALALVRAELKRRASD